MYRVNIMRPDMLGERRLKFSFARLKSIYRRRGGAGVSGLPDKTSIVGKYTQMRFRIVLHKLV